MNNEIKEILDYFKKYSTIKENTMITEIEDYIANLQTIEQQYSTILSENAELENKITNLQEELEEQKRIEQTSLDKILDLEDTIVDKKECIEALETSLTDLQEENKKLLQKSYSDDVKITKAIGWVKKNMYYFPRPDELLNILNGEDNEKD